MTELVLTIVGSTAVLIWCYLLLGRGQFWRIRQPLNQGSSSPENFGGEIAAIVPARNEAETVARSLASLLERGGNHPIQVFLIDDGSTDGTAETACAAAARVGRADGLTLIRGKSPPPGWLGKPWALLQGLETARELRPRFFLLTDADIVHAPEDLARLVAIADAEGYDLASLMVRLQCRSFAERLLIPSFVFFFFMLYPPRWTADAKRASAAAAGGCVLIRPEALDRAGGMEAIRDKVIDDCALARAVKRSGGRVWLGLANSSASLRSYHSFGEIGRMISRTAFNQLSHSSGMLLLAVAGMAFTFVLPVALSFMRHAALVAIGLIGWALMTFAYLPMVRYYKLMPLWALSLPGAALFYLGATLHSAAKYWLGHGGEWKGRVQDPLRDSGRPYHKPLRKNLP